MFSHGLDTHTRTHAHQQILYPIRNDFEIGNRFLQSGIVHTLPFDDYAS